MYARHLAQAVAALGVAALLTTSCNPSSSESSSASGQDCNLSVAFFGALTGSAANLGINIKNGAQLAVNQYGAEHTDCKVTLKPFDSEGDPAKAPALARNLVNDKTIIGIVGPAFSGESEAANPIFEQAGIPLITPSATQPSLSTNGWKYFHRAVASDDAQGPAAANYIKNVIKPSKVFVVDDQSAYGLGLADAVKKSLGPLVVGSDKTAADGKQTDFSATITKIRSSGATAMFYGGYYQNAGLIAKQMHQSGLKVAMVAGDGVNDPGFVKAAGKDAAEGVVVTSPCLPASELKGTFAEDYKKAWNTDPGTYSDVAFDATNIFLKGIAGGKNTPETMQAYLSTVDYTGAANTYKFTSTGDLDPSYLKVWAFKFTSGAAAADREIPTS